MSRFFQRSSSDMKLFFLIILAIANRALTKELKVIYEWKYVDYVWESDEQKIKAIEEGTYNHTQIFTIDVEKVPDGRVFVTTPAYNPTGVPATLSTVSSHTGPGGPLLRPYPNWSWHNSKNCHKRHIISVWRVAVDECFRLWVLDSGKIGEDQICPAQLLVFDLKTDRLQQRIEIPFYVPHNSQNSSLGLLITPVIETEGFKCERTWVYMADTEKGILHIWNGSWSWSLNNDVFKAEETEAHFSIAGQNFTLPDALFGLAVTPRSFSKCRRLFFRALASRKQYSVAVDYLHTSKNKANDIEYILEYQYSSQVAAEAFSRQGILFFGLTKEIAIGCWNMDNPMDDEHVEIIAQNDDTLQFASGLKVTKHPNNPFQSEKLWVMTNRFQKIATDTQNFDEINYRILIGSVDSLVKNTKCQTRGF